MYGKPSITRFICPWPIFYNMFSCPLGNFVFKKFWAVLIWSLISQLVVLCTPGTLSQFSVALTPSHYREKSRWETVWRYLLSTRPGRSSPSRCLGWAAPAMCSPDPAPMFSCYCPCVLLLLPLFFLCYFPSVLRLLLPCSPIPAPMFSWSCPYVLLILPLRSPAPMFSWSCPYVLLILSLCSPDPAPTFFCPNVLLILPLYFPAFVPMFSWYCPYIFLLLSLYSPAPPLVFSFPYVILPIYSPAHIFSCSDLPLP